MFKTTALDSVGNEYVDVDVGASVPGTRIEADDQNIKQDELVASVESSGQTLDPTGVKRNQVARAMFLNGVGSQSMVDSGTANAKVLTPVSGSSGYVFGETYAQLTGAVFLFKNLVTNTGAVTINCGQTVGTLIGVKSFTKTGGVSFAASELVAGEYYAAICDLANDRFEMPVNSMLVSDLAYSSAWNGVSSKAPSQNALYDIISTLIGIPSGEKILFYKNTAVVGYSLLDTLDDKLVYVTKGSAAGGQTGGTVHSSGTWVISGIFVDYHTHTSAAHKHLTPLAEDGGLMCKLTPPGGTSASITPHRRILLGEDDTTNSRPYAYTDNTTPGITGAASINTTSAGSSWRPDAYNFTIQQRN